MPANEICDLLGARRNALCTLYAIQALRHLGAQVAAGQMCALAGSWAPPLWRLLLAEPAGADYWVRYPSSGLSAPAA
jgi:hypothetical protein